MKILKTFVGVALGGGRLDHLLMDTIEYQGRLWLVPTWIDTPEEGMTAPARIICLSGLAHQKSRQKGRDFVLTRAIPKAVLDGEIRPQDKEYELVERPPIRIRGGSGVN